MTTISSGLISMDASVERLYGWYSQKQFDNHSDLCNENSSRLSRPYIYYKKTNGEIVQITEIKHSSNDKSFFDDAYSVGIVACFVTASDKPIRFSENMSVDLSNSCFR